MTPACGRGRVLAPVHAPVGCPVGWLDGRGLPVAVGQGVPQAAARADAQLGEDLVEVPLDGPRAEVELGADLGIRVPFARESRDVLLLRRELVARLAGAPAHLRAGRVQLVAGALGEGAGAHGGE